MTPRTWRATVLALAVGAAVLSCSDDTDATGDVPGGDPDRGRELLSSYGCVACHEVPGVDDAHGRVAPSLAHYAQRSYVAGILPNTPENLVRWIRSPQEVQPGNGMPDLGVSEEDAAHIAAYLRTLD